MPSFAVSLAIQRAVETARKNRWPVPPAPGGRNGAAPRRPAWRVRAVRPADGETLQKGTSPLERGPEHGLPVNTNRARSWCYCRMSVTTFSQSDVAFATPAAPHASTAAERALHDLRHTDADDRAIFLAWAHPYFHLQNPYMHIPSRSGLCQYCPENRGPMTCRGRA